MKGGIDMKRIFSIAFILTALVSCQKNEAPEQTPQENQPIKVTLTATIGGDTKVTFVDEDNMLKAEWELYNKVSLISIDSDNNVLSVDTFTAQSAGKTADFEGTFSNPSGVTKVWVCYPALTQGAGTPEEPYMSPGENGYSSEGIINGVKKGAPFITLRSGYYLQNNNADPSHLCQYAVMVGEAEMDGNNFTVNLEHQSYVIKATLKLPVSGFDVRQVSMRLYNSEGESGKSETALTYPGWRYMSSPDEQEGGAHSSILTMAFGATIDGGSGKGVVLDGDTVTAYLVGYGEVEIPDDFYYYMTVSGYYEDSETDYCSSPIYFNSEKTLLPGNMYRVSVDEMDI